MIFINCNWVVTRWQWLFYIHFNMYLVINKWVIAVKVSNFSGQYLRNHWTLDIGVLGYIVIVWPKEHSPEVRSFPSGTPCIRAYIHIYIHTYINTHTHTHTHTCTYVLGWARQKLSAEIFFFNSVLCNKPTNKHRQNILYHTSVFIYMFQTLLWPSAWCITRILVQYNNYPNCISKTT